MNQTTITDINIPFGRMVAIIFKFIIASIPAILFVYFILGLLSLALMGVFGGILAGSGAFDGLKDSGAVEQMLEQAIPQ